MGLVARGVHSPPFSRSGCAVTKKIRSLAAQTGWLVISNKIRIAARANKEATRPITNHPVCAAEDRELLIEAQPPLENGGEWTPLATKHH
jgi:hypothetical protein